MSLAALVLRTVTVKALRGRTLAGQAVEPSAIAPLEGKLKDTPQPLILVFTDAGETQESARDSNGKDLLGLCVDTSLSFEIAVAARVPIQAPGAGPELEIGIPETDEGFEISIDLIARQICAELQAGRTPWADLWRELVLRVTRLTFERGQSAEKGVRFAARRLVLMVETLADPTPGRPLEGVWDDVVSAIEADQETAHIGALIRSVAEGEAMPEWRHLQAQLGLTYSGLKGIGLAPLLDHQASDAAPAAGLDAVTMDPLGLNEQAGEQPTWDPPAEGEE